MAATVAINTSLPLDASGTLSDCSDASLNQVLVVSVGHGFDLGIGTSAAQAASVACAYQVTYLQQG